MEVIEAQPKQALFLKCPADIVLYGGSAGSGKTFAEILDPMRYLKVPGFNSVIFRKTTPDIKNPGGLWDESQLYSSFGGRSNKTDLTWKFPWKSMVKFASMNYEDDKYSWKGSQLISIQFDELTDFSFSQFFYMLSRNRGSCGIRPYMRGTTNPDSDHWTRPFIDWWIGPDGYAIPERSGRIRFFARQGDEIVWGEQIEDVLKKVPDLDPIDVKSFTFISASVYDNQKLIKNDPSYVGNLKSLGTVERERLLKGNWNIRPAAGLYFQEGWFQIEERMPEDIKKIVRSWDLAGTSDTENKQADRTASVKMAVDSQGRTWVLDAEAFRESPRGVKTALMRTAKHDGGGVSITVPQDPGQAGKSQAQDLINFLAGYKVKRIRPDKKKEMRASPYSSQVEAGNVILLKGKWNQEYIRELENFPEGLHDDYVDASSDAFNTLHSRKTGFIGV